MPCFPFAVGAGFASRAVLCGHEAGDALPALHVPAGSALDAEVWLIPRR